VIAMQRYDIITLHAEDVFVGERLRKTDPRRVEALASSIDEIGLQTPISIRIVEEVDIPDVGPVDSVPVLIAGAHRLAAVKLLGQERIECFDLLGDDIEARIWEIDENLFRAELTPAQVADHLKRRKDLWVRREATQAEESGTNCPTLTGRGNKGFAQDTAEKIGTEKRSINRAISRAERIDGSVLHDIHGTSLDKGVELDALARLPIDEQRALATRAMAGEKVSARKLPPPFDHSQDLRAIDKQVRRVAAAWDAACPEARRIFIENHLGDLRPEHRTGVGSRSTHEEA
jgi:hypothetical protein